MKTLPLSIELSSLALDASQQPLLPGELLLLARQRLSSKESQLGRFLNCRCIETRHLSQDMDVAAYELCYENKTLHFQFACFQPRGAWELQGFRWAA
ncbi:MAG: hypothetical protein H6557_35235 [Lewinellaceae bacterium]|nr:hypothetical protein [Phaeodactylibacter sp.]MCB9041899.1 hypothetical protein [Lewinellaceae bacterium]